MTDRKDLITLVYFNEKTKCLKYNHNIIRLEANGLFIDEDNTVYAIRYYNDYARVAFATLRESNNDT